MGVLLIAASQKDPAASKIADELVEHFAFRDSGAEFDGKPVYRRGDALLAFPAIDGVYANDLDRRLGVSEVIFASRHESASGRPTLSVHVPGNLGEATHGGRAGEVAWANPWRVKALLMALVEAGRGLPYAVSLEATHHGPTEMGVPVTFVEVGSSKQQWTDRGASEAVAQAIMTALEKLPSGQPAVGFGGGMYAPAFTETTLKSRVAVGHIVPRFAVHNLNANLLRSLVRRAGNGCELALIDRRGLGAEEEERLLGLLKGVGLEAKWV